MDTNDSLAPARQRTLPGSVIAVGLAVLAAVVAYFAFGMPGMDHSAGSVPDGYELVDAVTFEALLEKRAALVINVHVPIGLEIPGTDARIASDQLVESSLLPTDRARAILVYCRTGAMSADAANALVANGYTNVKVLRGGTDAWEASGRRLIDREDS